MSEEQSLPEGAVGVEAAQVTEPVEGAVGGEGEPGPPVTSATPALPPPSKLPSLKPSGIKPPSKIGRLCDGKPKAAPLPATPAQNGPTANVIRKLSDEPSRTKFSDASVVLTEDTDSFIIGDRVWVGGTKPGHIAYIGDTQFAPGDWAGIVLDEPIGKNDGSVGGIRYFQCEPKKGIFSRLTRLTRYPLTDAASIIRATSVTVSSSPPPLAASTPQRRAVKSPTGSVASVRSTTLRSPIDGNTTLTNSPEPKIGERVIVMSGQTGSKAGVLRYKGPTDFAAGEWCGVELDDPLGKNDGSVAGRRYFICQPNFGLFAPAHKVSRSPAAKRLSSANCQIHRPGRHGSRESLTSSIVSAGGTSMRSSVGGVSTTGSRMRLGVNSLAANKQKPVSALRTSPPSAVRNSLQDTVKAKDAEIEQLRKERDLERAEITRAATQADEAERKLAIVKEELDKVKEKALQEKSEIHQQMEELQFRMEEESITRAELQKTVESQEERLKQLDQQLEEERRQVARLQSDSDKLFETEEVLAKLQSDLEAATKRDDSSGAEHSHLTEKIKILELKLKTELDRITSLLSDISTKDSEIEGLKSEMTALTQTHGAQLGRLSAQLDESTAAMLESKSQLEAAFAEISEKEDLIKNLQKAVLETKHANVTIVQAHEEKLKTLMDQLKEKDTILADSSVIAENQKAEIATLCAKIAAVEKDLAETVAVNSAEVSNLNERIAELCSEIAAKEKDLEVIAEGEGAEVSKLNDKISALEKELSDQSQKFSDRLLEFENSLKEKETLEASLKAEILSKKAEIDESAARTKALEEDLLQKEALLNERLDTVAKEQSEQIDALKSELTGKISEVEKLNASVDILEKQILDLQTSSSSQIQSLEDTLSAALSSEEALKSQLTEMLEKLKMFESLSKEKEEECELLQKEISFLKENLTLTEKKSTEKVSEKNNLLVEAQSNIQRLEKDIALHTADLEEKTTLIASLQESKIALQQKLDTFQSHAAELELKLGDSERRIRISEERCAQLVAAKTKLEADITNLMTSSTDSSAQLNKVMADLREKERELDEERQKNADSLQTAERQIQERQLELDRINELLQKAVSEKDSLDETLKIKIASAQEREQQLAAEIQSQESDRNKAQEEIKELKALIDQLSSQLENSQVAFQQHIEKLADKDQVINDLSQKESLLKQECKTNGRLLDELKALVKELECTKESEKARSQELEAKLQETVEQLGVAATKEAALEDAAKKGEEAVAKTRAELESVRKELEEKGKTLEETMELKAAAEKSVSEKQEALERYQKQLEESQLSVSESRKEVEKLTSRLSEVEKELQSHLELALQQGSEKEASLTAALASREKEIADLRQNFEKLEATKTGLESHLVTQTSEKEAVETLLKQTQDRLSALTKEKEAIETSSSQREVELQKGVEELRVKNEELLRLKENINKQEEVCEELKLSLATAQKEREELVAGLTKGNDVSSQLEEKLKKKEMTLVELQGILEKLAEEKNAALKSSQTAEQEILKVRDDVSQQKKRVDDLVQLLEKQNAALQESQQKLEAENKEKQEIKRMLEEAENRELNSSENNKQQLQQYENGMNEALALIDQQKKQLETYTANERIHRDSVHLLESAQREKRSLEEKLAAIEKSVALSEANANNQDPSHKTMVEERDIAQGEVNFLNSVIVELQRKNEKLLAQINLLESGITTAEAEEYNLNGLNSKMVPPRLYCDICEMFDIHDTEECPQQCSEAVVSAPSNRKLPGSRPSAERPYCDNCEEFGHHTADCDETETY